MRLKIIELTKTCEACPAQWEGTLEDGRMIYIRYRWGYLEARVSKKQTKEINKAVGGPEIFGICHGGGWCGEMDGKTLENLTKNELDFSGLTEGGG